MYSKNFILSVVGSAALFAHMTAAQSYNYNYMGNDWTGTCATVRILILLTFVNFFKGLETKSH